MVRAVLPWSPERVSRSVPDASQPVFAEVARASASGGEGASTAGVAAASEWAREVSRVSASRRGAHVEAQVVAVVRELSGEALLILVKSGPEDSSAARERLLRDVMHIDGVKYEDAADKVEEMARYNYGRMGMLPYEVGIQTAITAGWLSIPLVFSYTVAKKFNDVFVTAEPPDVGEMDTILEIGSWTWGWMEPPLGTISFFLLCMQYSRDQRLNMGQKPYTEWYKSQRADRLAAAFPAYTTEIVRDYAKATAFDHSDCDGIDDMPLSLIHI